MAAWSVTAWGFSSPASAERYVYRIEHASYGAVGTWINIVETNGNVTTITTEAHIRVAVLGVALFTQEIARTERRDASRLRYFHSVTTTDGQPSTVDGKADGAQFVITSPKGTVSAPGSIRPADPWSAGLPGIDTVFMPDTGKVLKVHATRGDTVSLILGGTPKKVQHHRIDTADGSEHYDIWVGADHVPEMFRVEDSEGTVTFTRLPG